MVQLMSDCTIKRFIEPFASEKEKFSRIFGPIFFSYISSKFDDLQISTKSPMAIVGNFKP